MWVQKEVVINGKKVDANVEEASTFINIEVPYNKLFLSAKKLKLGKETHDIINCIDVGFRNETILITLWRKNNECESVESREDTSLSE